MSATLSMTFRAIDKVETIPTTSTLLKHIFQMMYHTSILLPYLVKRKDRVMKTKSESVPKLSQNACSCF